MPFLRIKLKTKVNALVTPVSPALATSLPVKTRSPALRKASTWHPQSHRKAAQREACQSSPNMLDNTYENHLWIICGYQGVCSSQIALSSKDNSRNRSHDLPGCFLPFRVTGDFSDLLSVSISVNTLFSLFEFFNC